MELPNFLLIGAAKSGTSSFHRYLGQHPDVFRGYGKEPSFFALEGEKVRFTGPGDENFNDKVVTDLAEYQARFAGASRYPAAGEASVLYLYSPKAPARIKHYVPDAKLIAILRNPIERAYSSFLHLRRDGREPLTDFVAALEQEDERIKSGWEHQWHYTRLGFYHEQPADQISVFTYEELQQSPVQMAQKTFRFLGVDDSFAPDMSVRYNESGRPVFRSVHDFITKPGLLHDLAKRLVPRAARKRVAAGVETVKRLNLNTSTPQMPASAASHLRELYREDVRKLGRLIGRDLSSWIAD
jgi:hypothetical protein